MLDGLEVPPPAQDLEKPKDTVIRDMSSFYDKSHDFSILLISRRRSNPFEQKAPPQIITID